jgi:glutamate racemase
MKYFHDLYPDYDYIFLADNKNCPFGQKNWYEIEKITFNALNRLFNNWAEIVIIACNTAAAYSIRKRQNLYPDKKALSITVPGIEEIISTNKTIQSNNNNTKIKNWSVWILATQATIKSDIYTDLYSRFWWDWTPDFHFVMAPNLVTMVESWISDGTAIKLAINYYISQFPQTISTLVLWCTHFSVYKKYFQQLFDRILIDPSSYSAQKFNNYLKTHSELEKKLSKNSSIKFYTTWDTKIFNKIWSNLCWYNINSEKISI